MERDDQIINGTITTTALLLLLLLGNDWYGNNTPLSITTNDDSTTSDSIVDDVDAFIYSDESGSEDTNGHDIEGSDEDTHVNNGKEGVEMMRMLLRKELPMEMMVV